MEALQKIMYKEFLNQLSAEQLVKEHKDVLLFKVAQDMDLWMYDMLCYEMIFRMKRG